MGALLARLCRLFGFKCGNVHYVYEYEYDVIPSPPHRPQPSAAPTPKPATTPKPYANAVKVPTIKRVETAVVPEAATEATVAACIASILMFVLPHLGGLAAILITRKEAIEWYDQQLRRPKWMIKSNWLTPICSTTYSASGFSTFLICISIDDNDRLAWALGLHCIHLVSSWAWPPVFYNVKNMPWAVTHALSTSVIAALCSYLFWTIDPYAGCILILSVVLHAYFGAVAWWVWQHGGHKARRAPFWGGYYHTVLHSGDDNNDGQWNQWNNHRER